MGAEPYWYFTKYESDIESVLQKLRQREFEAGRYNPAMPHLMFPVDPSDPSPGAQHATIDDAREAADADGTRSILDIDHISESPEFCAAAPLDDSALQDLFDTTQPTHKMVEANDNVFANMERGQAIYIIVYRNGQPDEIYFAGYSFD